MARRRTGSCGRTRELPPVAGMPTSEKGLYSLAAGPQLCGTNPICPARQMVCIAHPTERQRAGRAKQSQFAWAAPTEKGRIVRNKANWPCRAGGVQCTAYGLQAVAQNKATFRGEATRMIAGPCETKPIRTIDQPRSREHCAKQSQSAVGQTDRNRRQERRL